MWKIVCFLILSIPLFAPLSISEARSADLTSPKLSPQLENQPFEQFVVLFPTILPDVPESADKTTKGQIVFDALRSHAQTSQRALQKSLDQQNIPYHSYWLTNALLVHSDSAELLHTIAQRPDILQIVPNSTLRRLDEQPRETLSTGGERSSSWHLERLEAVRVWYELGVQGEGAVIGTADTGIDWEHVGMIGQYRGWNGGSADHNYNWHDAIHSPLSDRPNFCGYNTTAPCDDDGHGTATLGIAIGNDRGSRVVGVAPNAKWIACRLTDYGVGNLSTYTECLQWFLAPTNSNNSAPNPAKAPDVITNSWVCVPSDGCSGGNLYALNNAVNALRQAGIVVVAAAGNDGDSAPNGCGTIRYPLAMYEGVFTVGGVNEDDVVYGTSSRGPVTVDGSYRRKPNVVAYVVNVPTTFPFNDSFGIFSGTSAASPQVAGVVALMISANPALRGNVEVLESAIEQSSIVPTSYYNCDGGANVLPNNAFGFGRISAYGAVQRALQGAGGGYATTVESQYAPSRATLPPSGGYVAYNLSVINNNSTNTWPDPVQFNGYQDSYGQLAPNPFTQETDCNWWLPRLWPSQTWQCHLNLFLFGGGVGQTFNNTVYVAASARNGNLSDTATATVRIAEGAGVWSADSWRNNTTAVNNLARSIDTNNDGQLDSTGYLIGDFNLNGKCDPYEIWWSRQCIFFTRSHLSQLLNGASSGDNRVLLGRELAATWLNLLAGNDYVCADLELVISLTARWLYLYAPNGNPFYGGSAAPAAAWQQFSWSRDWLSWYNQVGGNNCAIDRDTGRRTASLDVREVTFRPFTSPIFTRHISVTTRQAYQRLLATNPQLREVFLEVYGRIVMLVVRNEPFSADDFAQVEGAYQQLLAQLEPQSAEEVMQLWQQLALGQAVGESSEALWQRLNHESIPTAVVVAEQSSADALTSSRPLWIVFSLMGTLTLLIAVQRVRRPQ